jgi:hypothetical protein
LLLRGWLPAVFERSRELRSGKILDQDNFSESAPHRPSTAREWSRFRQDFLLFFAASGIVWMFFYGVYWAFPFVQNSSAATTARKIEFLTSQPIFSAQAKVRILAFGNSKILTGLDPATFRATLSSGIEVFNAGRPGTNDFVILLKQILARGTRPTHLLVQTPPIDEHEESWSEFFSHDKRLVETLFPFRDFPHDLAQFLDFARREGGMLNAYKEHAQAVDRIIADQGYFFIKWNVHFPGGHLPDEYRLPTDRSSSAPRRVIDPEAPAFKELAGLSAIYRFKVIFIPSPFRKGEIAAPDPSQTETVKALSQVPNFFVAGPAAWVFEPRYFFDPWHLNSDGARLYSRRLAELTAPIVNSTE